MTKKGPTAPPDEAASTDSPIMVLCTVLDMLKYNGRKYGQAGNAAGWPDRVELMPAQAVALAMAGMVIAPAAQSEDLSP